MRVSNFCASALLFLHGVPVGDGSKAGRFAYMDFAELASTPLQSSGC